MDTNTIISVAPNQYEAMLTNYASIVEKTNNQIGLGVNLATLAVAILSVLIAVIAIFVAFALWKNSKEQKDRMVQFFSEQERIIKEKNKKIENLESRYDTLISEHEKKLKYTDKKDTKKMQQIQEDIDELKRERIFASAYLTPASGLQYPLSFNMDPAVVSPFKSILGQRSMICAKCGKPFQYYDSGLRLTVGERIVYCTHCGESNIMQYF